MERNYLLIPKLQLLHRWSKTWSSQTLSSSKHKKISPSWVSSWACIARRMLENCGISSLPLKPRVIMMPTSLSLAAPEAVVIVLNLSLMAEPIIVISTKSGATSGGKVGSTTVLGSSTPVLTSSIDVVFVLSIRCTVLTFCLFSFVGGCQYDDRSQKNTAQSSHRDCLSKLPSTMTNTQPTSEAFLQWFVKTKYDTCR